MRLGVHSLSSMNCIAQETQADAVAADRPDDILASILDNPHLPTPPALALRVAESASRPDCKSAEIALLLSQDPGLCGKVLKTVNSSLFGLSKPVSTLERAILVLGLGPLRSLVLALALPAIQTRAVDSGIWNYWQESLAGAVIARALAKRLKRPEPEDYFIAGLLRDVGKVVLAQVFPDEYRALSEAGRERFDLALCELEESKFGVHHAEVSAVVLESWRLPPEIVLLARYHHHPEAAPPSADKTNDQVWLIALASQLARVETVALYPNAMRSLLELAQTRLGMDRSALSELLEAVTPSIAEMAGVLEVDIGQCANLGAVLTAAAEALVKLSIENAKSALPPASAPARASGVASHESWASTSGTSSTKCSFRSTSDTGDGASAMTEFDASYFEQLLEGGRLHNYEIREVLGRGGMGIVFKAFDPQLARFVAIKMLLPQLVVRSDARKRFEREARSAAAIQHESVVTIYSVSDFNGLPYFVMEYVEGRSLESHLLRQGALPLADVVRFGRQIAAGLDAAHCRRVVHRDIKPANILVEDRLRLAKLCDFGLARAGYDAGPAQQGLILGTPLFMAPEQFDGEAVSEPADLFSLGSVLYTMCTSKPPFEGESFHQLRRQVRETGPVPVRSLRPEVPPWLEQLIAKLHAKQPQARCASAAEVLQLFERHS